MGITFESDSQDDERVRRRSGVQRRFALFCSPHGAQRNAGRAAPDFAALHPGYGL